MNEKQLQKIDALVAKHIMGLDVQGCDCCQYKDGDYLVDIPKYSLITAEAMWVFEELRRSGKYCCLDISSDYNCVWDVNLKTAEHQGNPEHKTTVHASSESLPLAICIAALKTKDIDIKKELKDG